MNTTFEQDIENLIEIEKFEEAIRLLKKWVNLQFNNKKYGQDLAKIILQFVEYNKFSQFENGVFSSFNKIELLVEPQNAIKYKGLYKELYNDIIQLYFSQKTVVKLAIRDKILILIKKIKADLDKILFIYSSPIDTPILNFEREYFLMQKALENQNFTLLLPDIINENDVLLQLLRHKPKVVHFVGHGSRSTSYGDRGIARPQEEETGGIFLKDDQTNKSKLLPPQTLKMIIQNCKVENPNLTVIFLNACYSAEYADTISQEKLYVIGVYGAIEDDKAIDFSSKFYSLWMESNLEIKRAFLMAKGMSPGLNDVVALHFNGKRVA